MTVETGRAPARELHVRTTGNDTSGDGSAGAPFATIAFANNLWYAEDAPASSRPNLPSAETGGVYGLAPDPSDASRASTVRQVIVDCA